MSGHLDRVRDHFHDIAGRYAGLFDDAAGAVDYPSGPARMRTAIETLERHLPAGRVLDLGCGTGHTALALCELGYDVIGVDIADGMVETSRALLDESPHADRAEFRVADAESLPLDASSVDAVLALGVTEWLEGDAGIAAEAARVLRPGGVAVVSFRNRLFNLFSMNDYTSAEIDDGEIARLVTECRAEFARGMNAGAGDEAAGALHEATARLATPSSGKRVDPLPRRPVDLRQHTPSEAATAYAVGGLVHEETVFTHFHPFPPSFESANPRAFNHLALAMESLARTPVGALMASGFLTVLRKP